MFTSRARAGKAKPGAGGPERRVWVRVPFNLLAMCGPDLPVSDPAWRLGQARDLGGGGASVELDVPFEPGTVLTLEVGRGDYSVRLKARVATVRPCREGWWLIGFAFLAPLVATELHALLS